MRFAAAILAGFALVLAGCSSDGEREASASPVLDACQKRLANVVRDLERGAATAKVYLGPSITAAELDELRSDLEAFDGVESVEYVSKAQALDRAKDLFQDSPGVLENLPGNPFPAMLDVQLETFEAIGELDKTFVARPGVEQIKTGGDTVRKITGGAINGLRASLRPSTCDATIDAFEASSSAG